MAGTIGGPSEEGVPSQPPPPPAPFRPPPPPALPIHSWACAHQSPSVCAALPPVPLCRRTTCWTSTGSTWRPRWSLSARSWRYRPPSPPPRLCTAPVRPPVRVGCPLSGRHMPHSPFWGGAGSPSPGIRPPPPSLPVVGVWYGMVWDRPGRCPHAGCAGTQGPMARSNREVSSVHRQSHQRQAGSGGGGSLHKLSDHPPPPPPRDALKGKGPQRWPQRRLGRRLEEVAKAVGGGFCRLQMPLRLALAVRGTVAAGPHVLEVPEFFAIAVIGGCDGLGLGRGLRGCRSPVACSFSPPPPPNNAARCVVHSAGAVVLAPGGGGGDLGVCLMGGSDASVGVPLPPPGAGRWAAASVSGGSAQVSLGGRGGGVPDTGLVRPPPPKRHCARAFIRP